MWMNRAETTVRQREKGEKGGEDFQKHTDFSLHQDREETDT